MKVKAKTALVTGAASGIGRAIAQSLAKRGCHLALADVDESGLAVTAKAARKTGVNVTTWILDVTDQPAIEALLPQLIDAHGGVDLLINNAGIGTGGTFLQTLPETFERVMDVNFNSMVRITRLFLPHLESRPVARIVNISSLFGIISPAEQTAYSASKFAVRGFSNALRFELEEAKSNCRVQVVHPGGVATQIAKKSIRPEGLSDEEFKQKIVFMDSILKMPPAKAGEIIVRGIERDKPRILVGGDAKAAAFLERLMPVGYWKIIGRMKKNKEKKG